MDPNSALPRPDTLLQDMPGPEISLDELYPPSQPDALETQPPDAPEAIVPPSPPPAVPFLQTGTGTVYETLEAAIQGTEVKDRTIETLRARIIQSTGIDPLTGRQIAPQAPQTQPQQLSSDPDKYFAELEAAVKTGDKRKYLDLNRQFINEQVQNQFGYILPLVAEGQRARAEDIVGREFKNLPALKQSPEYTQVLNELPDLRQAIETAESDLRYASQLPQLYKTALWAAEGKKSLNKSQVPPTLQTPVALQNRPTLRPGTVAPPTPQPAQTNRSPAQMSPKERADYLKEFESRGTGNTQWKTIPKF